MLFLLLGSVSAIDSNNVTDDSNLLKENNNNVVFSSQNMVSSNDSVSQTNLVNSRDDNLNNNYFSGNAPVTGGSQSNNVLGSYNFVDGIQANEAKPTSLVGNDTELYFKNGTSFKVLLSDNDGNPLANQSIIFTINNVNYTRKTNDEGIASIKINLDSGNYELTSTYGGTSSYESSSTTNLVKVISTISGDDVEKYFKNNTQYYATFVNATGGPLINTTVTFNINGVFYERRTNDNGTAKLNINLEAGEYIITATNPINGEMHSNIITVLTTVYGSDIVKYYKNDTQYYATFVNATGGPLINTTVTFNINGVFYERRTNDNGTAKLNINLDPNEYIITATNPINGEMHSNIVQVLPTIFGNDLVMYYRNGSQYIVYVLDGDGSPLANSSVTFNINGVLYGRKTNENGTAKLNINLDVGNYIITAKNEKGLAISNLITINKCNSTIDGKNSHIISFTEKEYTVKLKGFNNNKSIVSVPVHFKYANRTVDAITNENGEATILISNLSEGKYKIEYEFDGNNNYNPSKSNSTLIVANSTVILFADDLDMVYKDGSSFNVTLTDLDEKPIANHTIKFTINGVSYNRNTNAEGMASLKINLDPGSYTISYSHSNPDEIDYYIGSNTIGISKRTARFYGDDLVINAKERGVFNVTLVDSNNETLGGKAVIFKINGASYYRTTDENGSARLGVGLEVGYYPITVSLDDVFYGAETLTKHVLVNGTIIVAEDLNMVVGTDAKFSVSLKDAYGNPISNASIKFDYCDITTTEKTNSKGVASIIISNLNKGDYPIVYNYTERDCSGMVYIHVIGTIPLSQLVSVANSVNLYIERNAKLPASVSIDGVSYSTAQYLYLLSEAIVNINNGDLSNLYVLNMNNPANPRGASNLGNLNEFVSIANYLMATMDKGITPDYVSTSIGDVGYDGLVYAFTRVLVYYGEMGSLPSTVAVKSLIIYESTSVLDSANTITDLSPYLAPSKNCQADNAQIVALAERLTKGLTTSVDKAVAIYNYVRSQISYSFYYDTRYGALGTLNAGTGNCVDQAHLLIALYRAANLPARYAHGTCTFSSGTYGHIWAQVLIGDTWVVSDPTSTRNSFGKVVNWNNYNYALKGYFPSISF